MDKRVITQLDLLEKYTSGKSTFKLKDDELTHQRSLISKLNSLLESTDKSSRDIIVKNNGHVAALVVFLQTVTDNQILMTTVKCISDIIGKSNYQKRAQVFVYNGITKAILTCIYNEFKENAPYEDLLLALHHILHRVSSKDRKVAVRARLNQCLPVVVSLLRIQIQLIPQSRSMSGITSCPSSIPILISKNITVLLQVLKIYCHNLTNTGRLGRIGIITVLMKILVNSGKNNLKILKLTLESFQLCVRTKSNAARAVNHGVMQMLLQLFLDWNRMDSKDRQFGIRRCILGIVKNVINIRSGKKAFFEADGLHTLYGFCESHQKSVNNGNISNGNILSSDTLVTLSSLILRKCFPRNRLPLTLYNSVLQCPLPSPSSVIARRKITRSMLANETLEFPTPIAPRSTSPLNRSDYTFNQASCQGDVELLHSSSNTKRTSQLIGSEDEEVGNLEESANRVRAQNIFKSLDKKLQKNSKKADLIKRHQSYLNRYSSDNNCNQENDVRTNIVDIDDGDCELYENTGAQSVIIADREQQDEQLEQNLVEQILLNGNLYRPIDDRPLSQLVDYYQQFIFERELVNQLTNIDVTLSEESNKIPIPATDSDCRSNETENQYTRVTKRKTYIQPTIVSLQLKDDSSKESKSSSSPKKESIRSGNTEKPNTLMSPLTSSDSNNVVKLSLNSITNSNSQPKSSDNKKVNDNSCYLNFDTKNQSKLGRESKTSCSIKSDYSNQSNNNYNSTDKLNQDPSNDTFTDLYIKNSILITRSLGRFNMIAYPDLFGDSFKFDQPELLLEMFGNLSTGETIGNTEHTSKAKRDSGNSTANSNSNNQKKNRPGSKKNVSGNNANKSNVTQASVPLTASNTIKCTANYGGKYVLNSITTSSSNVQTSSSSQSNISTPVNNIDYLAQNKILDDLRRVIDCEDILEKVVYDLDEIVASFDDNDGYTFVNSKHSNADELDLDKFTPLQYPNLMFDSQFESGNLRKVIQIRQYEYDLILNPDINANHHIQWFYFRVSAMESGVPYRFNIINCEKPNSQFNFGMQPLLFSVKEALKERPYWRRWGSEIFYYKNHFSRSAATCGGNIGRSYYTCTFMIEFPHASDVCYLAYHYPYTYTRLLTDLNIWSDRIRNANSTKSDNNEEEKLTSNIEFNSAPTDHILFTIQEMCTSIVGNPVPLLTITNRYPDILNYKNNSKKYIFLTSRVHPGESNSSWVIRGCIEFLLGDSAAAKQLRDLYIFKIIPMLNPDGVINGCHRCSMAGQDLNRRWLDPCENLNPTIYHTKGILMLLTKLGHQPLVFCDLHGHSRRKNIFMFGCSPLQSWLSDDLNNPTYIDQKTEDQSYLLLPSIFQSITPAFSLNSCSFVVDKIKESTARVVVWRQFGVQRSYTLESSYCSCENSIDCRDNNRTNQINVPLLETVGSKFAESLLYLSSDSLTDTKLGSGLAGVTVTGSGVHNKSNDSNIRPTRFQRVESRVAAPRSKTLKCKDFVDISKTAGYMGEEEMEEEELEGGNKIGVDENDDDEGDGDDVEDEEEEEVDEDDEEDYEDEAIDYVEDDVDDDDIIGDNKLKYSADDIDDIDETQDQECDQYDVYSD